MLPSFLYFILINAKPEFNIIFLDVKFNIR
jgi:hypothetical protein